LRNLLFCNFFNEFADLLPLTLAQIQEADADCVAIVNGLDNAAEPEVQAFASELSLNARVDAHRKPLVSTDATAAQAQVKNAPLEH
jgi:hypothetical protein